MLYEKSRPSRGHLEGLDILWWTAAADLLLTVESFLQVVMKSADASYLAMLA